MMSEGKYIFVRHFQVQHYSNIYFNRLIICPFGIFICSNILHVYAMFKKLLRFPQNLLYPK